MDAQGIEGATVGALNRSGVIGLMPPIAVLRGMQLATCATPDGVKPLLRGA